MNIIRTMIILFGILSLPAGFGLENAMAGSTTAPATVTINDTCGFAITGGTGLGFLPLNVGEITSNANERTIIGTNTGNFDVDVLVTGTQWDGTAPVVANVMDSEVTKLSLTAAQDYTTQMTGLATTATADVPFNAGTTTPTSTVTVYFKLGIFLNVATFSGVAGQTDTFAFDCPTIPA